ncbi:MAG: hypothetical protein WB698_00215 [Solirubrobacteraceae bacterium]
MADIAADCRFAPLKPDPSALQALVPSPDPRFEIPVRWRNFKSMGDRFQAGETELARPGVLGRSRGDRTSRSCEPTPIELLQRTAGNRRTAQLLGAPALLQRKLQIGGSTLTRESRHRERRPLMNDIDRIVKDKKYVTTVSAYGLVHQWIDDDTPHQFGSVDLLVNKLFEEEKLYKPARGGTLGPTKLGSRPDFSAEAKTCLLLAWHAAMSSHRAHSGARSRSQLRVVTHRLSTRRSTDSSGETRRSHCRIFCRASSIRPREPPGSSCTATLGTYGPAQASPIRSAGSFAAHSERRAPSCGACAQTCPSS